MAAKKKGGRSERPASSPNEPAVLPLIRLPNGLQIELGVGGDPSAWDVAIGSTDSTGSPGSLNRLILESIGYPAQELRNVFNPPATLVKGTRGQALIVQTVGPGADANDLLKKSLDIGLASLGDQGANPRKSIWLPLLGTGSGGLSMRESFDILLEVLRAWEPGETQVVRISAPGEVTLGELATAWFASPSQSVDESAPTAGAIRELNMEPHVARALSAASVLAEGKPVKPFHVALAIAAYSVESGSKAFRKFKEISNIQLNPDVEHNAMRSINAEFQLEMVGKELRDGMGIWQRISSGEAKQSSFWGRDLVTAVLLANDSEMSDFLENHGTNLELLRDQWYHFVTKSKEGQKPKEWKAWWNAAEVPVPGIKQAGHITESDQGDDKLGIETEAAAFARLILDEKVEPPLSIGLLGDWGAGKSFFIEQIKKQISNLKGSPGLHEHVVEIEFNAWQASDSNLWASLVTYIFDEIWKNVAAEGSKSDSAAAKKQLLDEIKQAHGAVHESEDQVAMAREVLKKAETGLAKHRELLAWKSLVNSFRQDGLQRLAQQVGLRKSLDTINEVEKAIGEFASSGSRIKQVFATLAEKPYLYLVLPVSLITIATVVVWFGIDFTGYHPAIKKLVQPIVTLVGGLGALVAPLGLAKGKVDALTKALQKIKSEYDAASEKSENKEKLAEARRELLSAEESVVAARSRLAELLNQQAAFDPGRRLGAFLQDRVQSTTYRSQQGIISLVHKDFEQLSNRMKDWRSARKSQTGKKHPDAEVIKPFDRIVLYVDDLDRCRPQQVVNMLEAVHLLLALDLFVVVVAVDCRWLTRALQVYYKDLLGDSDAGMESVDGLRTTTAQNYLEKIFQITYALGPMDPAKFKDYILYLAGAEKSAKKAGDKTIASGASMNDLNQHVNATPNPGAIEPDRTHAIQATLPIHAKPAMLTGVSESGGNRGVAPPIPAPHAVHIGKREREFLGTLAPLLPTPRIAKRLVNVYRLIKASKSAEAIEQYEEDGRFRPTLLMLALLFGRSTIAVDLFRKLHERTPPFENPEEDLIEAVKRYSQILDSQIGQGSKSGPQWKALAEECGRLGIELAVDACARETGELARYSIITGHEWHTWKSPAKPS